MISAGAQETGEGTSNMTITVGATGTVSAPLDIAVEASVDSADAARGLVADNVSQVRDTLSALNVTEDQIRTTHFVIQPVRDENGTVTYRAVHALELRVPVGEAGSVVDAVVGVGARLDCGIGVNYRGATPQ